MSYVFTAQQLCLQALAKTIWERRGLAKRIGLPYGEETVTETFLLDLATTYPGAVTIVPFTKWLEGKSGSDWAWSFVSADGSYSYPMMMQAKVLDDADQEYNEIKRTIGKTTMRQIDRLLDVARKLGFPAYYAFYNHITNVARVPDNCNSLQLLGVPMPESWGVSIAAAEHVLSGLPDQSFDRHRAHSMPLHCLLCSFGTGTVGPFGTPGIVARRLRLDERAGHFPVESPDRLPPGVQRGTNRLFDLAYEAAGIVDPDHRGSLIARLKEIYPGIDGVVIVRDRKN